MRWLWGSFETSFFSFLLFFGGEGMRAERWSRLDRYSTSKSSRIQIRSQVAGSGLWYQSSSERGITDETKQIFSRIWQFLQGAYLPTYLPAYIPTYLGRHVYLIKSIINQSNSILCVCVIFFTVLCGRGYGGKRMNIAAPHRTEGVETWNMKQ